MPHILIAGKLHPAGLALLDATAGVTYTHVEEISEASYQDHLEQADAIKGDFVMEVSSPGIDRPLTRLEDFETYVGLEARLELDRMADGRKRFKGVLAGLEDGAVAIDEDGREDTTLIPYSWIVEAKLVLSDALMKRGADARAARIDTDNTDNTDDNEED